MRRETAHLHRQNGSYHAGRTVGDALHVSHLIKVHSGLRTKKGLSMGKNFRKSSSAAELLRPTPERLARGDVKRLDKQVVDVNGQVSRPFVSSGYLRRIVGSGDVHPDSFRAGERFQELIHRAALDGPSAADMMRVPGQGRVAPAPSRSAETARLAVWSAIDACGGFDSFGGSCAWWVVGFERQLRDWATTATWQKGPIDPRTARGIVLTVLDILRAHFPL